MFFQNPIKKEIFMTKNKDGILEPEVTHQASQGDVLMELIKAYASIKNNETQLAFNLLNHSLDLAKLYVESDIKHKELVRARWNKEEKKAKKASKTAQRHVTTETNSSSKPNKEWFEFITKGRATEEPSVKKTNEAETQKVKPENESKPQVGKKIPPFVGGSKPKKS